MRKKPTADLLLEIGTEELPADYLSDCYHNRLKFDDELMALFGSVGISFKSPNPFEFYATPRRMVFVVRNLNLMAAPLVRGPAKAVALDHDGKPTDKLEGFLKSQGKKFHQVEWREIQGKQYACLVEKVRTQKVLPGIVQQFLKSISFPKTMRWDSSGVRFARPIRSLTCFLGGKAIRFTYGSLKTGDSVILREKDQFRRYRMKSLEDYFLFFKHQGVKLDPARRKELILNKLHQTAERLGGKLHGDSRLLEETAFLCEKPVIIAGSFSEEFLSLPKEILFVSMARKQRVFSVVDSKENPLPSFIGVLDGKVLNAQLVSKNVESILKAKLQDSLFFFNEDTRKPLDGRLAELKGLVFLKGLGSVSERTERLKRLCNRLADHSFRADEGTGPLSEKGQSFTGNLERAITLSKCDLVTQMVGEFPELQGLVGSFYAEKLGESQEVIDALKEQYLPKSNEDELPQSDLGRLLAIADKIDLVAGCFAAGYLPSGSNDPYGQRRSVMGIIRILLIKDKRWKLSLQEDLIGPALEGYQNLLPKANWQEAREKLTNLFKDRLESYLLERYAASASGLPSLVVAILASGFDDVLGVDKRMHDLSLCFKNRGEQRQRFDHAAKVVERTGQILKGVKDSIGEFNPNLIQNENEEERELWRAYEDNQSEIYACIRAEMYAQATDLYGEVFFDILDRFFDKVLVNVDDSRIRLNRLSLLKKINDLYASAVADLSRL